MDNEEKEIELGALFMALLHRWWIILFAGLLLAAGGFGISKYVLAPTYESVTAVYVVNKQDNGLITYSDLQLGTQLTKDYKVLAKSRTVLERVISELGLNMTVEQLRDAVSVTTEADTRIMYITASASDPALAQRIADKTRDLAAEQIKAVMNVEEINIAETANYPTQKVAPSIRRWTLLGGMFGAFLAAGMITLLFLLNDKIKSPDDVERYLKLSTLGTIPYSSVLEKQNRKTSKGEKTGGKACRR